jgi:hypothetical protein
MPPGWSHDGSSLTSRELQSQWWKKKYFGEEEDCQISTTIEKPVNAYTSEKVLQEVN